MRGIDWVIIGGESGPDDKVRLCDIGWIRGILDQCQAHGVAPFVKQLGARVHLNDPRGGDPEEWPDSFRIGEFPR